MPKTIQVRSVPDDTHRALKVQAARAGMSLSGFLLAEMTNVANRPSIEDVVARLREHRPASLKLDSARLVRQMRDGRH